MTDARNAILLGDLHLKQGKTKEAIEAYKKALDQTEGIVSTRAGRRAWRQVVRRC